MVKKVQTIAIVSHNLPSKKEPYLHPFIIDHYQTVDQLSTYSPLLLCPAPLGIPGTVKWSRQFGPILNAPNGRRFTYLSFPKRRGAKVVRRQLAARLLSFLPPPSETIVHLHWLYPVGIVAPILKEKGYRVVLMVHGGDWRESVDRPDLISLFREALLAADVVLVSGDTLGREIVEEIPELTYQVIGNYIDTDLFTYPSDEDVSASRNKLGWDPALKHLLSVANVRPEKGLDLLLEGLAMIHIGKIGDTDGIDMTAEGLEANRHSNSLENPGSALDNLKIHIIGQPADLSYQKAIDDRLEKLPAHLVEFHSPVSRQELRTYYHASDGFILPSRAEGFNVSLLEAAGTGLPLIATETGDAAVVLDGCDGSLIPVNQSREIAISVLKWLRENAGRSTRSREFILNHYSLHIFQKRLQELYDGM